jgi:hemerythrin-like metal-binding protein
MSMAELNWTDRLSNGLPAMDATHRDFIAAYNALARAPVEDLLPQFDALIEHLVTHFDQENRWMEKVGFPACHRAEHDRVLQVAREVRARVAEGDLFLGRRLIEELPLWFENHVDGMDAALAFHLDSIGFDVEAGEISAQDGACAAGGCTCAPLEEAELTHPAD